MATIRAEFVILLSVVVRSSAQHLIRSENRPQVSDPPVSIRNSGVLKPHVASANLTDRQQRVASANRTGWQHQKQPAVHQKHTVVTIPKEHAGNGSYQPKSNQHQHTVLPIPKPSAIQITPVRSPATGKADPAPAVAAKPSQVKTKPRQSLAAANSTHQVANKKKQPVPAVAAKPKQVQTPPVPPVAAKSIPPALTGTQHQLPPANATTPSHSQVEPHRKTPASNPKLSAPKDSHRKAQLPAAAGVGPALHRPAGSPVLKAATKLEPKKHDAMKLSRNLIRTRQNSDAAIAVEESVTKGTQLCKGDSPSEVNKGSVALVMTGAAFRAKNFHRLCKVQCVAGTKEMQENVSRNHVNTVVRPLEKLGYKVDVFLTSVECDGSEVPHLYDDCVKESSQERLAKSFNNAHAMSLLKAAFGPHRVAGIINTETSRGHVKRVEDAITYVQRHAIDRGQSYEYLIALRYDVQLQLSSFQDIIPHRPNLDNVSFLDKAAKTTPTQKSARSLQTTSALEINPLTFFASAEDYLIMFPGGFTNCVVQLFHDCFNHSGTLDYEPDNERECYDWGPLQLDRFDRKGQDYLPALLRVRDTLWKLGSRVPLLPAKELGSAGVFATGLSGEAQHMTWGKTPPQYDNGVEVPDQVVPYYYAVKPFRSLRSSS